MPLFWLDSPRFFMQIHVVDSIFGLERTAKASAPYLGNSTLAKTMVAGFASISAGYHVFPHTSEF